MYKLSLNLKPGVKFKIVQEEVNQHDFPQSIQQELQGKKFAISGKKFGIAYVDEQMFTQSSALEMSLTEALV